MQVIVGKNLTLKTLLDKPLYNLIMWSFIHDGESNAIATISPTSVSVSEPYQGRVTINKTNGNLFLKEVKPSDNGDYSISVVSPDLKTRTSNIEVAVLGECPPTPCPPLCKRFYVGPMSVTSRFRNRFSLDAGRVSVKTSSSTGVLLGGLDWTSPAGPQSACLNVSV